MKDKILYLIEEAKEQLNYTIEYCENELKQLKLQLKRENPIIGYNSYLTETQKLNQQVGELRNLFYVLTSIDEEGIRPDHFASEKCCDYLKDK